jgi:2-C-methyl-D-erythritol 4-phosphate cytidylyltransferase/2-C-methyl-D-erythritol 2,4-cyclodiphosphate synthase
VPSVAVVIVAAGKSSRLGGAVPKQLLDVGGRSILQRSVAAFDAHPAVVELAVVLPAEHLADGRSLVGDTARRLTFVAGGVRRQDSVRAGVAALQPGADVVLIHDAARPFADRALIDRVIAGAAEAGAAVPAVPATDTVKHVDPRDQIVRRTLPREEIWLAQTPQGFRPAVLADAIACGERGVEATDEAMLAEQAGHAVRVVAGDARNVKITTADGLAAARAAFAAGARAGTGYDLHRLVEGRALVLAGVIIPFDRGPAAHSDGDVVCHAIVDALFGAAAAGDIGQHFPDSDPAWRNAPGLDLLGRAVAIVRGARWTVVNVDVTVVLERPRLAPHLAAVRAALAGALGIAVNAVSVKAKTNEGVDAVGRGEAIAAHAVAVLAGPDRP